MIVHGFELPSLLQELLDAGRWPRTCQEAMRQNLHSLVLPERVRRFASDESSIFLNPPPFAIIGALATGQSHQFWSQYGALDQISPAHSLILGDFGIGSDAPIILDYREGSRPTVLRLRWTEDAPGKARTDWVKGANSFDEFADMLGLRVNE